MFIYIYIYIIYIVRMIERYSKKVPHSKYFVHLNVRPCCLFRRNMTLELLELCLLSNPDVLGILNQQLKSKWVILLMVGESCTAWDVKRNIVNIPYQPQLVHAGCSEPSTVIVWVSMTFILQAKSRAGRKYIWWIIKIPELGLDFSTSKW